MFNKVSLQLNFPEVENRILKFWHEEKVFLRLKEKNKGNKKFSFLDGPITANNPMGVHHAWGRTYKDIFQRYKAMKGFDQRFQNGFDCQGLWVEVEVEKELGFNSKKDIEKYGIAAFVNKCKERVHKFSKIQTKQSIRLGQWMDWGDFETDFSDKEWLTKSHSYYTMAEENNYTIWHFLKKCHDSGWIYKGTDVMPWCTRCGTAISNMEIATEGYKEMTHKSVTIRLPILNRKNEYLLVWTTTPWTLTSNTAVAVHPELIYAKVKQENNIYYIAKALLAMISGPYELLEEFPGKNLVGLEYTGPFDELTAQKGVIHKVIPWKEISETEGTGMVHIAPGCGKEDYMLGKEFNLAVIAPLNESGNYIEGFDWLSSKNVSQVEAPIIENLKSKNLLYRADDYAHRYPVCWRCSNELVFRLVDEWYISMNELRHKIMDSTKKVTRWIPDFGFDREMDWLKNMDDWCISKKRYWGLALPIWECKSCGHFEVIGSRDELKEKTSLGWDKFEGNSPHRPWVDEIKIKCKKCGKETSRIPDVGNPWLDAGIVPFSTIRNPENKGTIKDGYPFDKTYWKEWFPAEFITECFPGQFRNWFYAILTMSTVLESQPPFKILLGHASVRDEKGEEMHKSKGNAIWFDDAAEKMGADVMRWMFTSHNPEDNLNFGYGSADLIKRKFLTLWNTFSFFVTYANIDNFNPTGKKLNDTALTTLDKWILSRLNSLVKNSGEKMDKYEVIHVTREIDLFIDDLSTWYLRCNRSRYWKSENDSDKETAFLVLYECLLTITKIIAPIMPFFAEELYQNMVVSINSNALKSVHLCDYPAYDEKKIDKDLEGKMHLTRLITSMGRSARNETALKIRQPLESLYIKVKSPDETITDEMKSLILKELNIKGFAGWSTTPIQDNTGWHTVSENDYSVLIKTAISTELKNEGFARELVHKIQNMRKEANFQITDRIKVYYNTTDALKQAIDQHKKYIQNETLAVEMLEAKDEIKGNISKTEKVNTEKALITIQLI